MKSSIRLLAFFLNSCEYGKYVGGAERRFLELTTCFSKLGVETFALEYKPSLAVKWGYSSYHSIEINRKLIKYAILGAIITILHGIRACASKKCDIVYVPNSGVMSYSSMMNLVTGYVVSFLCRKPLVIVFHHVTPLDHLDRNGIRILAHKHAKACIVVSQVTARAVERSYNLRSPILASNGVNLDVFTKIKSQKEIYDAVFFGRMSEDKGTFTLLDAWKTIITKIPSAQLLLLGGTTELMNDTFKKTINKLGLDRNVTISGFVSDQEAIRLLKSSRIFLFPAINAEGFGLVIVEAMAAGLPCVLSNLPVFKENFHSAAVFVEPNNPKELAKTILALFSDPETCRKLKKRSQRLVKQFSWDNVAKKELDVFKTLVTQ